MFKNERILIQHESYRPNPIGKWFKRAKRLIIITMYASLAGIIIHFVNANTSAFAKEVAPKNAKLEKTITEVDFYTQITNNENVAKHILFYSKQNSIEASLLAALIKTESNFNPLAINYNYNGSTDRGLCQLNNRTFPHLKVGQFYDIETNISHGAEFLKWCLDNANYNVVVALAYYNAGIGNVSRERVGDITLNYINKILAVKDEYDTHIASLMQ